jgi:YD repeat-containing protein
MRILRLIAPLAVVVCASKIAGAAQTVTYAYDALGRLTDVQILAGPGNGVTQNYVYDAAGNRTQQTISAPGQGTVTLSVPNPLALVTSAGITLTVNVSGSAGGTVTFTENGVFIGIATVVGGQASIHLEGFPAGTHSIRATYSGDGTYAPRIDTFSINVRDIRWLPAVLQLLLSD